MTKTERLLSELIALPSVNPAFTKARSPHAGERRLADYLASVAAAAGLDVEFQDVLPGRSNVLARLVPAGGIRHRVLLVPHLDTVGGGDPAQFIPQRRNGRLHGRGACDTKGSVAVMLSALAECARAGVRPRETEVVFAGVVDEENAQAGARALAASKPKAGLAIVGEPTRLRIVTAHKGSLWLKLDTRGKAAHGARPELGRNAIHAMARVVAVLETDYAASLRKRRHPLLGSPTVNVGTINGGTQANIVPDHCGITVDRRTLPGETEPGVRREIASFLTLRGLKAAFAGGRLAPCAPLETDPRQPLVRQFMRTAGQRRPAGVDFFCDAAVLAGGGIPSVVFGPGDIAQAHTEDEWIAIESLSRARNLLIRFLRSLP